MSSILSPKFFNLMHRHEMIDAALRFERTRPAPDVLRVHKLARLRKAIKERIATAMRGGALKPALQG